MRIALAGLAVMAVASSSAWAQVNYGNFTSPNYVFQNVTESSGTDPVPLFGAPVNSGGLLASNALTFSPSNFQSAASSATFATDTTDGQLNFTVRALPGSTITDFIFSERGDYTLSGLPTAFAQATVGCSINIRVVEVNGTAILPVASQFNLAFNGGGIYTFPPSATAAGWNGTGAFNVSAFLASMGINGQATKIEVALDNTLTTTVGGGASALIRKKQAEGVIINIIPAPSSAALIGLGGLIAARRRRA